MMGAKRALNVFEYVDISISKEVELLIVLK
jgi:hypothetical protein